MKWKQILWWVGAYALVGLVLLIASQISFFRYQEIYAPTCLPNQDCGLVELAARQVTTVWFYILGAVLLVVPIVVHGIHKRK